MAAETYTGHIYLDGPDKGRGEIRDAWGWVIGLSCVRGESEGRSVLVVSGTLGPTPEKLRVQGVDDLGTGERV